jgi:hypothetical protein
MGLKKIINKPNNNNKLSPEKTTISRFYYNCCVGLKNCKIINNLDSTVSFLLYH